MESEYKQYFTRDFSSSGVRSVLWPGAQSEDTTSTDWASRVVLGTTAKFLWTNIVCVSGLASVIGWSLPLLLFCNSQVLGSGEHCIHKQHCTILYITVQYCALLYSVDKELLCHTWWRKVEQQVGFYEAGAELKNTFTTTIKPSDGGTNTPQWKIRKLWMATSVSKSYGGTKKEEERENHLI